MKTPREILFDKHLGAAPELDRIRQAALGEIAPRRSIVLAFWQELILPSRRTWAALAVAWAVVIAFRLATGVEPALLAGKMTPPTQEAISALRDQRKLMAQLLENGYESPKPIAPKPRSQLSSPQAAG